MRDGGQIVVEEDSASVLDSKDAIVTNLTDLD